MARGRWPLHRSLRERSPSPLLRHREEFGGGPPPHASRREELVYRFAVGFVLEARLDRLPVGGAGRARERGGNDRLADAGVGAGDEIGRAHVCTPVTNAHIVRRLLLEIYKHFLLYLQLTHTLHRHTPSITPH